MLKNKTPQQGLNLHGGVFPSLYGIRSTLYTWALPIPNGVGVFCSIHFITKMEGKK